MPEETVDEFKNLKEIEIPIENEAEYLKLESHPCPYCSKQLVPPNFICPMCKAILVFCIKNSF